MSNADLAFRSAYYAPALFTGYSYFTERVG
jgi:hypothetical protein